MIEVFNFWMARVEGIEPSTKVLETSIIPFNYTRSFLTYTLNQFITR